MSKRRDTPALYELVYASGIKRPEAYKHDNPLRPTPSPEKSASDSQSAPSSSTHSANPEQTSFGRTIRLPMGYVFLAVAGLIVLLVMAYSVGYSRGGVAKGTERAELGGFGQSKGAPGSAEPATEESGTSRLDRPGRNGGLGGQQPQGAGIAIGRPESNQPSVGVGAVPARTEDTRQSGLNYIIVEQFAPSEADAVADFLLARGIDVMVLPTNNRTLQMVVVRTGYRGWSSNQAGQAMLRQIRRFGLTWASSRQGSKNFSQAYGQRFN